MCVYNEHNYVYRPRVGAFDIHFASRDNVIRKDDGVSNKLFPLCLCVMYRLKIHDISIRGSGPDQRVSWRKRDTSTDKNGNEEDTIDECRLRIYPIDSVSLSNRSGAILYKY